MEWLRFLFGFPYEEAPRSYIRKLTLAPKVKAFQLLKKGENIMLTWKSRKTVRMTFPILYVMPGNILMILMSETG